MLEEWNSSVNDFPPSKCDNIKGCFFVEIYIGYHYLNKKVPYGSESPTFATIDAPPDPPH